MLLTRTVGLHCWVCGESFEVEEPRSYTVSGRGSDLCPRPVGFNPLPMLVHSCPNCGFSSDSRGFAAEQADEGVREWALAGGLKGIGSDPKSAHGMYERAALCHARREQLPDPHP